MKDYLFSCHILTENSLGIECAEYILAKGHSVLSIITSNLDVSVWANNKAIACYSSKESYDQLLRQEPFDYVFSIVNFTIISEDIISFSNKNVINFHDSCLPTYAGINATTWAIINQENKHGVTWHIVEKGIDCGNILKQKEFDLGNRETSFTLNMRCALEGYNAFCELINELSFENTEIKQIKQDIRKRTYFSRYKRPDRGCVITFNSKAEDIDALRRALDFGGYDNSVGCLKFVIDNEFYILKHFDVLKSASGEIPGNILNIDCNGLVVATKSNDICITKIAYSNNIDCSMSDFILKHRISDKFVIDDKLPVSDSEITALYNSAARHEKYWVDRISNLILPKITGKTRVNLYDIKSLEVLCFSNKFINHINNLDCTNKQMMYIFALLSIFIMRMEGKNNFDIGISYSELNKKYAGVENLFSSVVPMRIDVDRDVNVGELVNNLTNDFVLLRTKETFVYDIFGRYSKLLNFDNSRKLEILTVGVAFCDSLDDIEISPVSHLYFVVSLNEMKWKILYNNSYLSNSEITMLYNKIKNFMLINEYNPEKSVKDILL